MKSTSKRLLFVDDELGIRNTLPVILRKYGFIVRVAATVEEALEEIRQHNFDVLLCDLNIERESDGYEVVRAMRQANPRSVVVILTAYPGMETAIEGIRLSVDDYVVKPQRVDTLVALLAEKLAAHQPKARILTVSYDEPLLKTLAVLLETHGYEVVSASGRPALEECSRGAKFDVLLLGSCIPAREKQQLVEAFRKNSSAPVVSAESNSDQHVDDGADFHVEPDPEVLLKLIADIVATPKAPMSRPGISQKKVEEPKDSAIGKLDV